MRCNFQFLLGFKLNRPGDSLIGSIEILLLSKVISNIDLFAEASLKIFLKFFSGYDLMEFRMHRRSQGGPR